jgi:photosystem II stability/assembly factor-like uncharacterized protein
MRVLRKLTMGLAGMLMGALFTTPAQADKPADVLDTESSASDKAALSLLLDVERAGNRLVAVGARGHIVYSDDQGKTWAQASVPVSVLLTAVSFVDDQNGWAVGHGAVVVRTRDGGLTWTRIFDGNKANEYVIKGARSVVSSLEEKLAAATEEEAEEIEAQLEEAQFAMEDAEADSESGAAKPLMDVWFSDARQGYVVGAYGMFFRTSDGGDSWEYWAPRLNNPERFHLNVINKVDGAVFVAGEAGQIYRSLDNGINWTQLESPYDGSFFGVSGTGAPNEVLAYGLRGNTFRSEDNGDTWIEIASDITETLMAGAAGEGGRVTLVGNSGMLIISQDGGRTFAPHPREDRMSLTSVLFLSADRLLLVGEGGVSVIRGISQLN